MSYNREYHTSCRRAGKQSSCRAGSSDMARCRRLRTSYLLLLEFFLSSSGDVILGGAPAFYALSQNPRFHAPSFPRPHLNLQLEFPRPSNSSRGAFLISTCRSHSCHHISLARMDSGVPITHSKVDAYVHCAGLCCKLRCDAHS